MQTISEIIDCTSLSPHDNFQDLILEKARIRDCTEKNVTNICGHSTISVSFS